MPFATDTEEVRDEENVLLDDLVDEIIENFEMTQRQLSENECTMSAKLASKLNRSAHGKQRKPAMMRGLDQDAVINISDDDESLASSASMNPKASAATHVTRERRNGRSTTKSQYDMTFHPSDIVLRRSSARRKGYAPPTTTTAPHDDEDSDEQVHEHLESDSEISNVDTPPTKKIKHETTSTRRSTRTSLTKRPLYDMRRHPQDRLLIKAGAFKRRKLAQHTKQVKFQTITSQNSPKVSIGNQTASEHRSSSGDLSSPARGLFSSDTAALWDIDGNIGNNLDGIQEADLDPNTGAHLDEGPDFDVEGHDDTFTTAYAPQVGNTGISKSPIGILGRDGRRYIAESLCPTVSSSEAWPPSSPSTTDEALFHDLDVGDESLNDMEGIGTNHDHSPLQQYLVFDDLRSGDPASDVQPGPVPNPVNETSHHTRLVSHVKLSEVMLNGSDGDLPGIDGLISVRHELQTQTQSKPVNRRLKFERESHSLTKACATQDLDMEESLPRSTFYSTTRQNDAQKDYSRIQTGETDTCAAVITSSFSATSYSPSVGQRSGTFRKMRKGTGSKAFTVREDSFEPPKMTPGQEIKAALMNNVDLEKENVYGPEVNVESPQHPLTSTLFPLHQPGFTTINRFSTATGPESASQNRTNSTFTQQLSQGVDTGHADSMMSIEILQDNSSTCSESSTEDGNDEQPSMPTAQSMLVRQAQSASSPRRLMSRDRRKIVNTVKEHVARREGDLETLFAGGKLTSSQQT